MVWNIRLWWAPLSQPPLPSSSSSGGLLLNDISEWAIADSARANRRPFGVPRPLTRS